MAVRDQQLTSEYKKLAGPSSRNSLASAVTTATRSAGDGRYASQSGAKRSSSTQKATSESVLPIGRNRRNALAKRRSIPGYLPLCANTCTRPPSSRVKGCVLRRDTSP